MPNRQVLIIGDSISGAYAPLVREILAPHGIDTEQQYGGDCAQLLAGLSEWLPGRSLDLVQLNCGLHDARYFLPSGAYQQPIANYGAHLRGILTWLRQHSAPRLLWATTTPVITERIALHYTRYERDIVAYNQVALDIMSDAGIPVNDLHAVIAANSPADCISPDGVHMTERGNSLLADAVARGILGALELA
jgi:lysophospholipase L1-like esterase